MVRAAALLALLAVPAAAADCRLALVLAMDVSSSVDPSEDRLQRQGTATALTSPEVAEAFFASDLPVALAVYEWSGRYNQQVILDWTMIDSPMALTGAAEIVAASLRSHNEFPTAMGYALGLARACWRVRPNVWKRRWTSPGTVRTTRGLALISPIANSPLTG